MKIIPFEIKYLMVLCLLRTCLDLPLYIIFFALPIIKWLSQCTPIVGTYLGQHWMPSKKLWSHSTSSLELSKGINLDSIVRFLDFQSTIAAPMVETWPLVGLKSFITDIQFASQYPFNITWYFLKCNPNVKACFRYLRTLFEALQWSCIKSLMNLLSHLE